jgi:hypothetical protein
MTTRGLSSVSNVIPLPINGTHINTIRTQLPSNQTAVTDTSDDTLFSMTQQPPVGQGLLISRLRDHTQTYHSQQDSSGRATSPTQRPLPFKTQHSQETDINASGEIRTRSPNKRVASDPRLRPRGQWDRRDLHRR